MRKIFIALTSVLVIACGTNSPTPKSTAAPVRKSLEERLGEKNGYKKDADGNWKVLNNTRSSFETQGKNSQFSDKNYAKKQYKAGDYAKKSWWGKTAYGHKAYAGNTDASRFQTASGLQGKNAREAKRSAEIPDSYQTDSYATAAAREGGKSRFKKTSNDLIENKRQAYEPPEIIDWQEQRKLSMDQSKGILGH